MMLRLQSFPGRHVPAVLTLLALFLALTSIRLTFTDGDEGRYAQLGMAIAQGEGRTDIHLPKPGPDFLTTTG